MRKKSLMLLIAVLGIFFLFLPSVSAGAENDCSCNNVTIADKNKQVAALLKSDDFKAVKKDLKENGYQWKGAGKTEVDYDARYGYAIAIPVYTLDHSKKEYIVFANGTFFGFLNK